MRGECFVFIIHILLPFVTSKLLSVEIENFVSKVKRVTRSGASGNFSAHLYRNDVVYVKFCVKRTTELSIKGVYYSNDGPSDTATLSVNGEYLRTFRTPFHQDKGKAWNTFRSSGPFAGSTELRAGKHNLLINVTSSDSYGLELDKIDLVVNDETLKYADFACNLYCFDNINYNHALYLDSIPSGKFVQRSKRTKCAEQDNIRVDIYHDSATEFQISSHLPKYLSYSNHRDPSFEDCVLATPFWNFTGISIDPGARFVRTDTASLSFSGTTHVVIVTVLFNFIKFARTREIDERLIGSVLRLRLRNLPREDVNVRAEYRKKGRWVHLQDKKFTPFDNDHIWEIADRTWDVGGNNQIKLTINQGQQQKAIIEMLRLDRRDTTDDTFELYSDSSIVFQGVRLGFWHHSDDQPNSMTVETGNIVAKKVDSIRIYTKVPWTGAYSQVFVLFQDGRVRLQTMTPHGLDYIPFGSSVFIGQPKYVNQDYPYAPIRKVTIDPFKVQLHLEYANGNAATFSLTTTYTETLLKVSKALFRQNRVQFPIMTLKSMWIGDGQADVDHVTVNGGIPRHIIDSSWKRLYGTSAVFFRKCISQHNTQAPDIKIQFL